MSEIIIKPANLNIVKELKSINFDLSYIEQAQKKYKGIAYKIFNLKPYEGNILKQLCLSLGFDCALNRDSVTCKCEKTDCLIFATPAQYKNLIEKLQKQPFRLKSVAEKLDAALNFKHTSLKIQNSIFDWKRPYIMGILNITPDSFSDGGKFNTPDLAFEHCLKMIKDGADIIDIGGESTRPGANNVTVEEEIKRILPVIEKIRKNNIDIPLSIDTRNFKTAKAAIEAGADIINDVSALDFDKNLFEYVSTNNLPVIIMHSNKIPAISNDYTNENIVEDIYKSLFDKIEILIKAGMERKNIIADTGIGFGKSAKSNFEILRSMNEFLSLNVPLLSGISRKSFIRNTFNVSMEEADMITALYSAIMKNINIHRVHNVKLTKKFLMYTENVCYLQS